MVSIQIKLTEDQNKKVGIYRINHNFLTKSEAITDMIDRFKEEIKKDGKHKTQL